MDAIAKTKYSVADVIKMVKGKKQNTDEELPTPLAGEPLSLSRYLMGINNEESVWIEVVGRRQ